MTASLLDLIKSAKGAKAISDRVVLINGDMMDYKNLFPLRSIDLILTDPPYGRQYVSNRRVVNDKFNMLTGDESVNPDWFWFCKTVNKTGSLYCFTGWESMCSFKSYIDEFDNVTIKNLITWDKNNHGAGDLEGNFGTRTEYAWFATGEDFKLKSKRPDNIVIESRVSGAVSTHPTQKPIGLARKLFSASLTPDTDVIVFDPFMGVGASGVVAAERGHKYVGIEIDPRYFKIAYREIETVALQHRLF